MTDKLLQPILSTLFFTLFIVSIFLTPVHGISQTTSLTPEKQNITVGVREIKPFVIKNGDDYSGFSIELWDKIAERADLKTTKYQVYPNVGDLLTSVQENQNDIGVAAISITADRKDKVDFSQPMFNSGLKILVPYNSIGDGGSSGNDVFSKMYSAIRTKEFAWLIGTTLLLSLIPAHVLYFIEGRRERGIFSKSYFPGIFQAFGWTMTTLAIGTEDSLKTRTGRIMGIVWTYVGIVFIAFFTANITSDLTTQKLQDSISSVSDLVGKRVASVKNSTASQYLDGLNIAHTNVDVVDDAFKQLNDGNVDAVVYDSPSLEYYESHEGKGKAKTVGDSFKHENYGIAMPIGSPLRAKVDKALLKMQEDGTYTDLYNKWFGK
jgi:polar amino acid transport system substrate-binding protein